jgi:D-arabinose 1-dehydrogenase-like Zn-dependent alcohol dehydrogenase
VRAWTETHPLANAAAAFARVSKGRVRFRAVPTPGR